MSKASAVELGHVLGAGYQPGVARQNRRGAVGRLACCVALVLGAAGCRCSKGESLPAAVSDEAIAQAVGNPQRVAVGDLDGDRRSELVTVDAERLRVADSNGRELARVPVPGGIQVLRVTDVDRDGRAEILAGWGRTREQQDAKARVSVYRFSGDSLAEEIVIEPSTPRNDVVEVLPLPGKGPPALLVAYFQDKYMVQIARAHFHDGRWTLSPLDTIRMATSFALGDVDGDGEVDLVVGRLYGDDIESDADAFVLRPDGSRAPIPVTGGVRSLHVVDLDDDGGLEVLVGDGWNKKYEKLARARLTRAWWSDGEFRTELLEESPGQYTHWKILAADLDGDGHREIVTRGSAHVRVLSRKGDRWEGTNVASGCLDAVLVDLDPRPGAEVLVICEDGAKILRH